TPFQSTMTISHFYDSQDTYNPYSHAKKKDKTSESYPYYSRFTPTPGPISDSNSTATESTFTDPFQDIRVDLAQRPQARESINLAPPVAFIGYPYEQRSRHIHRRHRRKKDHKFKINVSIFPNRTFILVFISYPNRLELDPNLELELGPDHQRGRIGIDGIVRARLVLCLLLPLLLLREKRNQHPHRKKDRYRFHGQRGESMSGMILDSESTLFRIWELGVEWSIVLWRVKGDGFVLGEGGGSIACLGGIGIRMGRSIQQIIGMISFTGSMMMRKKVNENDDRS
ncbi:hypothetical protein N7456_005602, partial [Penicillium angulare]